jgi:hypothetical protein
MAKAISRSATRLDHRRQSERARQMSRFDEDWITASVDPYTGLDQHAALP